MANGFMTPEKIKFIYIFKNTMKLINENEVKDLINNSVGFTDEDQITFESKQFNTKIYLDNKDTFDKAIEMGRRSIYLEYGIVKECWWWSKDRLPCSRRMFV